MNNNARSSILFICVKSRSSGLKSDRGSSREMGVSHRGGPEVRRRYESGDLIRSWCRLVCHALVKVVVLDFRGTEVQRYRGEQRHEGGLQVRGWETLLIYELRYKGRVQRTYTFPYDP